ncbi:hypothetical protein PENSUB_5102 [Penicillium subrubescens]|uniref:Uncharacterized protein n=1 Tax=Penicillium subrubescens TaxID=1316194 RepID=A0A1Q5UAN6_9EURO|nr:hypothetical protein PENSUB_5102 [Penicillium subrubescens]
MNIPTHNVIFRKSSMNHAVIPALAYATSTGSASTTVRSLLAPTTLGLHV